MSSKDLEFENEHDLWRWYTSHLDKLINPTSVFDILKETFKKLDLSRLIGNIKKIFMPKKINVSGAIPQKGGYNAIFTQTDNQSYIYYTYRLDSYKDLLAYLHNNDIQIDKLTAYILKKMYLYHYDIEYMKALNYILFKIKDYDLPDEFKTVVSNVFRQIAIDIYNTITN